MYRCTHAGCGYRSHVVSLFTVHLRTHCVDKLYKCSFEGCGYGAGRRWQLKVHERTHTGEQPYECELCSKRFKVRLNALSCLPAIGSACTPPFRVTRLG